MLRCLLLVPSLIAGCGTAEVDPPVVAALDPKLVTADIPLPFLPDSVKPARPDAPALKPKVKLAVLVVFDQMRGDYIDKWKGHFGEGGFKRLQADGAWFADCHYPYAITTTGPGHAAMLTGAPPAKTGVVNNEWYDRAAAKQTYCAGSERYAFVPPLVVDPDAPKPLIKPATKMVGNPDKLLSPTVGDEVKAAGRGKVFGLSLKDRSAIFPTGKKPDGAYWFDGRFVTSTYYRDVPHAWVAEFNKGPTAASYFGNDWTRFKPDLDYDKLAGPDDGAGEGKGTGQGVKFPHPTTGGKKKVGKEYYEAVADSPFGNDLLLDFAKTCIAAEKLGQRDGETDLLTVSFSSNDLIGHTWGPDSHEVLDVTLRSDALMADFLTHLDATVGKGNWAMVVTADHGICPLPEFAAKQGLDAKRVSATGLLLNAEKHLRATFGKDATVPKVETDPETGEEKKDPTRWIEAIPAPYVYLNHKLIRARNLDPETVAESLAAHLKTQDGIQDVYTYSQLKAGTIKADDAVGQAVLKSFHPDRSGDLFVVLKPYHLIGGVTVGDKIATGTTHGSPHEYDIHVVFLAYGPGVAGGMRGEKVTPLHAAAILADFAGVPKPKDAEYDLPKTLWAK